MTPQRAGQTTAYLRRLRGLKIIDPHTFAVADTLLFRCRRPGDDEAQVSYERLAKLAGVGRRKAVEAVARLRDLGLLSWRQTRLRFSWAGGEASRQWRNIYRWIATEFPTAPANQVQERKKAGIEVKWRAGQGPQPPIRSVAGQLAFLRACESGGANRVDS